MCDVVIKVSTDQLIKVSGNVETKIQQLEKAMENISEIINSSKGYWNGESHTAFTEAYQKKNDDIAMAFKRFRENVTDLLIIAGVYEQMEKTITQLNQTLQVDLIV